MDLYKITIRPISSYCSPLQSDTLFGAFCWSYLYGYGENALHKLIDHYKCGAPDIIFSNAFPSDRLPVPAGLNESVKESASLETKQERYKRYIADKNRKQASFITLDGFNDIINGRAETALKGNRMDSGTKEEPQSEWRNMVSRESDTVENIDGASSLFEVEQYFAEGAFDIYIYSDFDEMLLENVLTEMFSYGIGAQRSVGKGGFRLEGRVERFGGFQYPLNPDSFVALSNFVPARDDPTDGSYKAFVKYPKVSYTENPEDSPFKKPILFLQAGSIFRTKPVKEIYGSCVENIALKDGTVSDRIIIGAYTIAVPCCLGYV